MKDRWRYQLRRCLLRATALSLACNFVVPAGYMPAALGDGGPFALCGFESATFEMMSHGAHHNHVAGEAADPDSEDNFKDTPEYCPLGALSASSAVPTDFYLYIEFRREYFQTVVDFHTVARRPVIGFLSRAPPYFHSRDFLI